MIWRLFLQSQPVIRGCILGCRSVVHQAALVAREFPLDEANLIHEGLCALGAHLPCQVVLVCGGLIHQDHLGGAPTLAWTLTGLPSPSKAVNRMPEDLRLVFSWKLIAGRITV